jgi:hypothetical protein
VQILETAFGISQDHQPIHQGRLKRSLPT